MGAEVKLLLVEDSSDDSDLLLAHLKKAGFKPSYKRVETESQFKSALEESEWDAVICDFNLPKMDALSAISILRSKKPDIPCIVVSGSMGEELAVETMRTGANDYIMKDNLIRFVPVLRRELKEAEARREKKQMELALKRSEEDLRRAQKSDSIGKLASGIAHDFNNILQVILMQADVLIESLDGDLSREKLVELVQRGLDQIVKIGGRASNLTRQLMAYGSQQVVQPQVLNVNEIILDMEAMFGRVLEENIQLKSDLEQNLKNIKADPGYIEQILMNLVLNSRDAMPKGGTLLIQSRNVQIDIAFAERRKVSPGPYVCLTVTDTGSGMTPEVLEKIFDPFYTTKPVGKGTGLGLSTVYGIVKQAKGFVTVDSEIGRGTSFRVFFPITEESVQPSKARAEIASLYGTETILVVEDEDDLRQLVQDILSAKGYKVIATANGVQALEYLRSNQVQLILTDVIMPEMSGVDLAKHAQTVAASTKILFQSGYLEDILIQNGIQTGTMHFLDKPYTARTLLTKVRAILG